MQTGRWCDTGGAEVDAANERSVLQIAASVPCWKRVSERAATATVTCLFHFPHPEGSQVTAAWSERRGKVKWKSRKRNQSLKIRVRNKLSRTKLVLILSLVT